MKKFGLVVMFLLVFQINNFATLIDIDKHWAYENIIRCVQNEYINGYDNNTFCPDSFIKYNEFIKILTKTLDQSISNDKSNWYATYIDYAIQNNLIEYNENLDYDNLITREDVFKILFKYIELNLNNVTINEIKNVEYPFNDRDNRVNNQILFLYSNNIISGYPDYTMKLENNITRAEVTVLLNRVIDYINEKIYTKEKDINIFKEKNISHFTNYIDEEKIFQNTYYIENNKLIFLCDKNIIKEVKDNNILKLLLNLLNENNYVLNTYIEEEKCVDMKYGDTIGYILNNDQIFEIKIFDVPQSIETHEYKVKITIYRLWKEIYDLSNNLQNKYYTDKLKKVLDIYLYKDEIYDILDFITEQKDEKTIKSKNKRYLMENKKNILNIYI